MQQATICFPIRGSEILLGMKKERPGGNNFGVGKWNGFGGRQEAGEAIRDVARRELEEESGLVAAADDLEEVAHVAFFEDEAPMFECTIFLVRAWQGVERETDEMRPRWFDVADVPYGTMWAGDHYWLPLVLAGKKFDGTLRFKPGAKEVASFEYTERNVSTYDVDTFS
jgi:8-oxo-dGTP diphosphatase